MPPSLKDANTFLKQACTNLNSANLVDIISNLHDLVWKEETGLAVELDFDSELRSCPALIDFVQKTYGNNPSLVVNLLFGLKLMQGRFVEALPDYTIPDMWGWSDNYNGTTLAIGDTVTIQGLARFNAQRATVLAREETNGQQAYYVDVNASGKPIGRNALLMSPTSVVIGTLWHRTTPLVRVLIGLQHHGSMPMVCRMLPN